MSLQSQFNSFVVRVAERFGGVEERTGTLDGLKTAAKTDLVAAINELADRPSTEGANKTYQFVQVSPARVWTVNHNLGLRPSVSIVDSGGAEIEADVRHSSPNQLVIYFAIPMSGLARLT